MKLKLIVLFIAIASLTATAAAPWDGTRDDLKVFTVDLNGSVFGTAGIPTNLPSNSVEIFVSSTDKTVTAFRVSIEYTTSAGVATTDSRTVEIAYFMSLAFFGGIKVDQISSVTVTRLHDGLATNLTK